MEVIDVDSARSEEKKGVLIDIDKERNAQEWIELGNNLSVLQEMGFPYALAQTAVVETHTLDAAINFCIANTMGFDHPFAEDLEWGVDSCIICGRSRAEHPMDELEHEMKAPIEIKRQKSELLSRPDRFPKHPLPAGGATFYCVVCSEDYSQEDMKKLPCGHSFCLNCLDRFYTERVTSGRVTEEKLTCPMPDCKVPIPRGEIEATVEDSIWQKYLRFLKEAEINADPNARYCPQPRCDNVLYRKRDGQKRVECSKCGFVMCFDCRQPFHGNRSCDKNMEDNVAKWANEHGVVMQKCPSCGIQIEKSEGCNHMTCGKCHYQFCWLCKGKYSDNHFAPWNVFGCPALQYMGRPGAGGCLCRSLLRIGLCFLYILAIPFLVLTCLCCPPLLLLQKFDCCEPLANKCIAVITEIWSFFPCADCIGGS